MRICSYLFGCGNLHIFRHIVWLCDKTRLGYEASIYVVIALIRDNGCYGTIVVLNGFLYGCYGAMGQFLFSLGKLFAMRGNVVTILM